MEYADDFIQRAIADRVSRMFGPLNHFQRFCCRLIDIDEIDIGPGDHNASAHEIVEFKNSVDQAMFAARQAPVHMGFSEQRPDFLFVVRNAAALLRIDPHQL